MRRTRSAASAAGIPAAVTNNGRTEDPRTTGRAWVAVRNLDLATPITGMPNSACLRFPLRLHPTDLLRCRIRDRRHGWTAYINRHLTAYANLDNAFNEHYNVVLGYPALGLNFRGGLRFRFGGE